jgi:pimeloyl-ACP methyl ester carboxylesterase
MEYAGTTERPRGRGADRYADTQHRLPRRDVMTGRSPAVRSAAAVGAARPADGRSSTYVLVHGAWHGGWCWSGVARILRQRGHTVFTPTQTGLGERSHLLSKAITLDVFVDDIANVLTWEELEDVILVGHSFGGSVISGVADRMRERIRSLVYLDALMLENGQSPFSVLPRDVVEARTKAAQDTSGGVSLPAPKAAAFGVVDPRQAAWVDSRLTPHPFNTYTTPLKLSHPVGNSLPVTYIACVEPVYGPLRASRDRVKAAGWKTIEIKCGHDAMVIAPEMVANLLERESG